LPHSKASVDRLGERLRVGINAEDLKLLDEYRLSFAPAYEVVRAKLRSIENILPSGRPAKSTTAIVDKLRRESIRLSQVQDIAGCRIVVDSRAAQNSLTSALVDLFPVTHVSDRREKPSHGYRAVHVIVKECGLNVEIQVRTRLQQLWAELSEKLADHYGPGLKYGEGPENIRKLLENLSNHVRIIEIFKDALASDSPEIKDRDKKLQIVEDDAAAIELQMLLLLNFSVPGSIQ
jgi:putative GTP pyrophosphokinase